MHSPTITSAVLGIASHIAYFNHGEHHLYATTYLKLFVAIVSIAVATLHYTQSLAWLSALRIVAQCTASYLTGLYSHLLIYRLLLHPLRRFPGPLAARISSLWLIQPKQHQTYLLLQDLHAKYGPIVRIGSSDLSIALPEAVEALHGSASRCTKAAFYDFAYPSPSLQTMRDPHMHHQRRRVWSGAFSDKRLRGYEQRIRKYRQKLVDELAERENQAVDFRKWSNLYSFDVMGDMGFGEGFESLERGEDHWAVRLLVNTMNQVGLMLPIWLLLLLTATPGLSRDWWRFLEWCGQRLVARMEQDQQDIPDVSTSLIKPMEGRKPTKAEQDLLDADSRLVIVAGSDTTSGALATALYLLVQNPEHVDKLRAELQPYRDPNGEFLHSDIASLEHLNGVINETLRLFPPVPGVVQRKTPPEGIEVAGVHIPGEMTVSAPQYVLGRSPRCYEKPDEFIPERWYKHPELVREKAAFAPFLIGPYNCIGRPLALLNLRTTLARLITTFDVRFAPGETGAKFVGEANDDFVMYWGELNLVFTRV